MKLRRFIFLLTLLLLNAALSFGQAQVLEIDSKLKIMANELATQLKKMGKTRLGVADFNDLQGNVPELGKFLAEVFQGQLVTNQVRVVNRQRLSQLLIENELSAQRLLNPDNALTIGKAAGMEVIIVGTITAIDARTLSLNVLGLDIQGAEAIASAKTYLNRNESLDQMLRTVVRTDQVTATSVRPANPVSRDKNSASEEELPKDRCVDGSWRYGTVCFENRFSEPVLLYKITQRNLMDIETNVLIAPGNESCSPFIMVPRDEARQKRFHFKTLGEPSKSGFTEVQVVGCKQKHLSLAPASFHLSTTKD